MGTRSIFKNVLITIETEYLMEATRFFLSIITEVMLGHYISECMINNPYVYDGVAYDNGYAAYRTLYVFHSIH